jgi:putative ATPase
MPECRTALFQLALYLAKAPKSNITDKIDIATTKDVQQYGNLPVPMQIRNAPTKMMKDL